MKRVFHSALFLAVTFYLTAPVLGKRKLQTSAVAQVGSHVVTSREVRMNAIVDKLVFYRKR